MTSFVSVATGAARYQDISMNPQKLAGQCAKLKCCINYEVDAYVEAQKRLPSREIVLETKDNSYYHFKTDIFKREITYSTDKTIAANLVTINASRAFDVINMNKKGIKPVSLEADNKTSAPKRDAQDILGQDSVTRFDNNLKKKKKKKSANNVAENNNKQPQVQQAQQPNTQQNQSKVNEVAAENNNSAEKPNANQGNKVNNTNNKNKARNNNNQNNNRNNNNRPRPKAKANNDNKQQNNNKAPKPSNNSEA